MRPALAAAADARRAALRFENDIIGGTHRPAQHHAGRGREGVRELCIVYVAQDHARPSQSRAPDDPMIAEITMRPGIGARRPYDAVSPMPTRLHARRYCTRQTR